MTNLIEKATALQKAINDMEECIRKERNKSGVFSWDYAPFEKEVRMQMDLNEFNREFKKCRVVKRNSSSYPYKLEHEQSGIVFFVLLSPKEYKEIENAKSNN